MLQKKTDSIKMRLAVALRDFGETAMFRCFYPFVESEPEAPQSILDDINYEPKSVFRLKKQKK